MTSKPSSQYIGVFDHILHMYQKVIRMKLKYFNVLNNNSAIQKINPQQFNIKAVKVDLLLPQTVKVRSSDGQTEIYFI